MKKILLLMMSVLLVSACGNKQIAKSSSTCNLVDDTLSSSIELQAENNVVVRAITSSTLKAEALGDIDLASITDTEKEQIKQIVADSIAASDETKGIVTEVIFKDDSIVVNSTISIEDADETFLSDLGLSSKEMTLSEAVEAIEARGATCR